MNITEQFLEDVANHEMIWYRNEGVNRHIRFRRPDTMCMHFDILTWPGYLCYTGDMGTYVFRRTTDMFEFFRAGKNDKPYRIDFRYWAEKVEAADKSDGIDNFSYEKFKANVTEYFLDATSDKDVWPADKKADLWGEINNDVLCFQDNEVAAWTAVYEFHHEGFYFAHWDRNCREYSSRFLWCCHALEWAIRTYDNELNRALNKHLTQT